MIYSTTSSKTWVGLFLKSEIMSMQEEIRTRTRRIGVEAIRLVDELPSKPASWVMAKQIVRSATAVGANYRAVCRAKSTADFINKLKIVEEETDETIYWLEVIGEAGLLPSNRISGIIKETTEILAIIVASIKTTRKRYS
jgi:four helix bundle protein